MDVEFKKRMFYIMIESELTSGLKISKTKKKYISNILLVRAKGEHIINRIHLKVDTTAEKLKATDLSLGRWLRYLSGRECSALDNCVP
jgi:hypothetical protein